MQRRALAEQLQRAAHEQAEAEEASGEEEEGVAAETEEAGVKMPGGGGEAADARHGVEGRAGKAGVLSAVAVGGAPADAVTTTSVWRQRAAEAAAAAAAGRGQGEAGRRSPGRVASPLGGMGGRGRSPGSPGRKGGTWERRAALQGRREAPVMHIEARHAQAAARARAMVEDVLLAQSIDALRYVEG